MLNAFFLTTVFSGTAFSFYNPQQGRWLSRDPIGTHFQIKVSKKDLTNYDRSKIDSKLYIYVNNAPIVGIDPFGLDIWECSRRSTLFPIGNHVYFWNDLDLTSCGTGGSSGSGGNFDEHDLGPYSAGSTCVIVSKSKGKEAAVMKCCRETANSGLYCPLLHDCHDALDKCLRDNCLPQPNFPRILEPGPVINEIPAPPPPGPPNSGGPVNFPFIIYL